MPKPHCELCNRVEGSTHAKKLVDIPFPGGTGEILLHNRCVEKMRRNFERDAEQKKRKEAIEEVVMIHDAREAAKKKKELVEGRMTEGGIVVPPGN